MFSIPVLLISNVGSAVRILVMVSRFCTSM